MARRLLPALARSCYVAPHNTQDHQAAQVRSILRSTWACRRSDLGDPPTDAGDAAAATDRVGAGDEVRPCHVGRALLWMHIRACKASRGQRPERAPEGSGRRRRRRRPRLGSRKRARHEGKPPHGRHRPGENPRAAPSRAPETRSFSSARRPAVGDWSFFLTSPRYRSRPRLAWCRAAPTREEGPSRTPGRRSMGSSPRWRHSGGEAPGVSSRIPPPPVPRRGSGVGSSTR